MIRSLKIERFRTFRTLRVEPLARVNLFVGQNNAGKTSVLEAVEFLQGTDALWWVPRRRHEEHWVSAEGQAPQWEVDLSHLFHGHEFKYGSGFTIKAMRKDGSASSFECEVVTLDDPDHPEATSPWALRVDTDDTRVIRLSRSRGLRSDDVSIFERLPSFMDTGTVNADTLNRQWDGIVLTPDEERVVEALRIIEPEVDRIAFSSAPFSGAFVKLKGENRRIPLGSMGEGMSRLLLLAMGLVRAPNRRLLVDDIDIGLHHSVMVSMWRIVVETAKRRDLQVFATTHSLDCVRALAWLCEGSPELAPEVTVHRVEKGQEATTMFSADDLRIAAAHRMEIR